jgi:hypothetical protein
MNEGVYQLMSDVKGRMLNERRPLKSVTARKV